MKTQKETKRKTKELLNLTYEEKKKCRFYCVNHSLRLFECSVHKEEKKLSHGLRLFPIHLWVVKDSVPYRKVDNDLVVWYDLNENG